ncbi:MAG: BMP family ABC transporter substrate-binding protein, partial [Chloroflexia bacterium]|nr:BMP family ABC transporter substrate-binding protein [Chloroflexia bacterium]
MRDRLNRRQFGRMAGGGALGAGLTLPAWRRALAQGATPSPVAGGPPFRVAFVYVSPVGDLGWTYAHD